MPMAGVIFILIVVTIWSYCKYGATFWDSFYPKFLATVFGVVFSIMLTWALWRSQQRAHESNVRSQLIQNLQREASVNSERINDIDVIFDDSEIDKIGKMEVVTLKALSFGEHKIRFLRTAAMKNFLRPENLVLINQPELEDDVDWLLRRVEKYNATLFESFQKFDEDRDAGKDIKQSINKLRSSITLGVHFLQGFLDGLRTKDIN